MVKFGILGPIELCDGGRQRAVGGPIQVRLLAYLLVHANRAVSADQLIDALWGDEDARGAVKRLHVAIARVRRVLEFEGSAGDSSLLTTASGYRLEVAAGELDAEVFRSGLEEGHRALDAGEPSRAVELLRTALELWRGPAVADVAYASFAQTEIRRLEELRLAALEARIEADLRLGRDQALIGELEALVVEHPARERLAGQLMLALYRCGRQTEALDVYQRTRVRLSEEFGLDPGPGLRDLQHGSSGRAPSLRGDDPPPPAPPPTRAKAPPPDPPARPRRGGRRGRPPPSRSCARWRRPARSSGAPASSRAWSRTSARSWRGRRGSWCSAASRGSARRA